MSLLLYGLSCIFIILRIRIAPHRNGLLARPQLNALTKVLIIRFFIWQTILLPFPLALELIDLHSSSILTPNARRNRERLFTFTGFCNCSNSLQFMPLQRRVEQRNERIVWRTKHQGTNVIRSDLAKEMTASAQPCSSAIIRPRLLTWHSKQLWEAVDNHKGWHHFCNN